MRIGLVALLVVAVWCHGSVSKGVNEDKVIEFRDKLDKSLDMLMQTPLFRILCSKIVTGQVLDDDILKTAVSMLSEIKANPERAVESRLDHAAEWIIDTLEHFSNVQI